MLLHGVARRVLQRVVMGMGMGMGMGRGALLVWRIVWARVGLAGGGRRHAVVGWAGWRAGLWAVGL